MKIYEEKSLADFDFWSGAKNNAAMLTNEELEQFGDLLEDCYPDGIDATTLNDIMWFDFEWVCEMLGLDYDPETDKINR